MKAPLLASIDIGSNSILLLVGRLIQGKLQVELQRKETIRLGGALDEQGFLQAQAMERGLDCLRRYAALIENVPVQHRRIVATQTLREAHNRDDFLRQASAILHCEVELISGEQEARLIYQGVSGLLPPNGERRLIVDIGGRSTEVCLGQDWHLQTAVSCPLGSVAWAQRFFADGSLQTSNFEPAQNAARTIFQTQLSCIHRQPWNAVYGSSGTAGAISKVLHQTGHAAAGCISRTGLLQLKNKMIEAGHSDRINLQGLREELRPVIGGGLSIMCAVFEVLHLEHMRIAQGALRHGVLLEMHKTLEPI
ncbi:MAG: Ppx/GppA family phosphatase [Comamonas sp.]|nr:Ppx/GppA family phosphatase [Comamonas sp.]